MSSEELVRVSDAERETAVAHLRDASASGRLTLEELSDRTGLAYSAKTKAELQHVTSDLPAVVAATPAAHRGTRLVVGLFGPLARRGGWRVARRTIAITLFAPCLLDLRAAAFPQEEATIWVLGLFGPVSVTVPEHVDVDVGVFTVFGPTIQRGNPGELAPGAPRLRIQGVSLFGPLFVTHRRS